MRIRTLFTPFLLLATLFCTFSCKKTAVDAPTVNIAAPLVDDNFAGGQDINIKGDVSDGVNLTALTVKITDDKTSDVLFTTTPSVKNVKAYKYDVMWTAKVTDWTDATVTVIAKNQAGMETTKTIKIKIWL